MADTGKELASLDFGNLIGGPLIAVITAQSLAAEATAAFIKKVGFYPDNQPPGAGGALLAGSPIYVDFKYPKEVQPYQPKVDAVAYVPAAEAVGDPVYPHGMKKPGAAYAATPAWTEAQLAAAAPNDGLAGHESGLAIGDPNASLGMKKPETAFVATPTWSAAQMAAAHPNEGAHPNGLPIYVPAVTGVAEVIGKPALPASYQEMKISVPILTMLPIPFIKVDIITIDFNAKITSTETATSSSDLSASGTVNANYGGKRASVSFSGTVAYKKSTTSGSSVERTYSMGIHVQASQDEMPAGMEKLLNLLEGAMKATPGPILLPAGSA
jgi:hypothetical protein